MTRTPGPPDPASTVLATIGRFKLEGENPTGSMKDRMALAMVEGAEADGTAAFVVAVAASPTHAVSKPTRDRIRLVAGIGVEGDAHAGATVRHRSRVARDPGAPNLRQVHLIHAELHDKLRAAGFAIEPGGMGENVTTRGVDLLALPLGARLHLGAEAIVELTGLRNPCAQLDGLAPGLMAATLAPDGRGGLVRMAGVMGVVVVGGEVRSGDPIAVELPAGPRRPLAPV